MHAILVLIYDKSSYLYMSFYMSSNYNRAFQIGIEKYNLPFHPPRKHDIHVRHEFPVCKKRHIHMHMFKQCIVNLKLIELACKT